MRQWIIVNHVGDGSRWNSTVLGKLEGPARYSWVQYGSKAQIDCHRSQWRIQQRFRAELNGTKKKVDGPVRRIKTERSVLLKWVNGEVIRSFLCCFQSTIHLSYIWFNNFNFFNFRIIIISIITRCIIFFFIGWSQRWFQLDIIAFAELFLNKNYCNTCQKSLID